MECKECGEEKLTTMFDCSCTRVTDKFSGSRAPDASRKWVSVEDELPKNDNLVTVYMPNRESFVGESFISTGMHSIDGWEVWGFEADDLPVTHWMPLPDPPEGE